MVPAEISLLSRWETISRKAQVCCSAAIRLMFAHLPGFEVESKAAWASSGEMCVLLGFQICIISWSRREETRREVYLGNSSTK